MGVLNVNEDSFFSGSRFNVSEDALRKTEQMIQDGADFIDLGASSSRPGAEISEAGEEWNRLYPFLKGIRKAFPDVWISVDTYHASTAAQAIKEGADLINDISAGRIDKNMLPWIVECNIPYVLMHMKGVPSNMQANPEYQNAPAEVLFEMAQQLKDLRRKGLANVIIDPGFGFGKSLLHNYQILNHLDEFVGLSAPILCGVSRKSMVTRLLEIKPEAALNATTALHMLLLQKGANILRVHDVKEAAECIKISEFYRQAN